MSREYRVLTALAHSDVPVPATVALCEDPEVIGAPFYVMQKLAGTTLRTADDTARLSPAQQRGLSEAVVTTLADLHDVDVDQVGLATWGRPSGYLERQLDRWRKQWRASVVTERPEVEDLLDRLARSQPVTRHTGIVHGDFKLDNLMVDGDDPTRIVGVLDWEMSTLGDSLTDLGLLLSFWDRPGEPPNPISGGATAFDGFASRAELVERYAELRGSDLAEVDWYLVLSDLKVAVILEGIHRRHREGRTVGEGFDGVGDMVGWLLTRASERAASSSLGALRGSG